MARSNAPRASSTAFESRGVSPGSQEATTEELQLQGHSLDNRLNWVVGGYLEISNPLEFGQSLNNFYGMPHDLYVQSMRLFGERVIPAFAGAGELAAASA